VAEHRFTSVGFPWRYKVTTRVYVEAMKDIYLAIQREKQIKGWTRAKKIALIASTNPSWSDLLAPPEEILSEAQDDM
jgi:putative endonuclease